MAAMLDSITKILKIIAPVRIKSYSKNELPA
jgi:hypothetical protein